ncbi:hypothetical protein SAY87_017599 [Trapa incisa]|uniref:Phosphoenolpyruvate carboxylase n=1 Tax=Trapa incisa TaxID=236973 RepID=A0AAN7LAJ0_9MYRT|nr:hypothetical protein SAY87_017599 [Trapa incisa]
MDLCLDAGKVPIFQCGSDLVQHSKSVLQKDIRSLEMLREMYNQWPFFRVTIDLVEMVFAKGDPGITALYDKLLVSPDLWQFGERMRSNYKETKELLLHVCGHRFT